MPKWSFSGGGGAICLLGLATALAWRSVDARKSDAQARTTSVQGNDEDWPVYGGQKSGDHYSPLSQINRRNVGQLKLAWTFDLKERGGLQTNPLVIGGRMFVYSPTQKVMALDASTGKKLWTFSAEKPGQQPVRGLTYWTDGRSSILFAGALDELFALDPATGKRIESFGDHGGIDLSKGLSDGDSNLGFVAMTTPGMIYKDMIIVGFREPETEPALPGDIRAFDVHTGKVRWTFHTLPRPGEYGYETWPKDGWKTSGAANNWCGMALDEARGILYAPTGSAVNDFYGDDRIGDDLFANTLLAINANTGKRLWHFQGVHHDIWDRDFPSPPALVKVHSGGKSVDAVVQTTKQGFVFLFDRVTGKPLFPIDERPFPQSDVAGERASPTQPVPRLPEPYARQLLTEDLLTQRTPEAHAWAVQHFKKFHGGGLFVPMQVDSQTIVFPGFDGGAEWGGSAVDPGTGVMYINANEMAWTGGLTATKTGGSLGSQIYASQCAVCHGTERQGSPPAFPSLAKVSERLSNDAIVAVIHGGKGRMPSFPGVDGSNLQALLKYLNTDAASSNAATVKTGEMGPNRSEVNGAAVYERNCEICHSEDLMGTPSNDPGLVGVRRRLSDEQILKIVHEGKGRMPAFKKLTDEETVSLLRFLGAPAVAVPKNAADVSSSKREMENTASTLGRAAKYRFTGYHKFLDPDGYPAIAPPWGTLNAIDLNTGKYLWKIPLGEYPELAAKGLKDTGSENYGGPIVTAGGLVIIAATNFDHKIRAFNSSTGELLWEGQLPYAGNATPATYMVGGKQYIVVATSGGRDPKGPQGSAYVAFALP